MKVAFCTCVQIGLSCIEAIYKVGGQIDLFISLPDSKAAKKSGRIYLDEFANQQNIPLVKSNHINGLEVIKAIKDYRIDWLFIIGWSQIASLNVINAPKYGTIGAHPTLLPEGRGRAAVPWAILKGLEKTGVTLFKMDEGVDTGEILAQYEILLHPNETATELYHKVNDAHIALIEKIWNPLQNNNLIGVLQDESKATYWEGRKPEDGLITSTMTIQQVDRLVRATTHPYPGAFLLKDNIKYIVWSGTMSSLDNGFPIQCVDGIYYGINVESVLD